MLLLTIIFSYQATSVFENIINPKKTTHEGVTKCDKRRNSPSKIEGAGGSIKTLMSFTILIINPFCTIILLRPSGTSSILEEEFS